MSDRQIDELSGVETTGHEWDGLRELNNPLPRWWLWTFYATIVWAIGYMIAYPAWPLLTTATQGVLGYSSRAELRAELDAAHATRGDYAAAIARTELPDIMANENLRQIAVSAGAAAFRVNCVQCHGSGATGGPGFPNLNDDAWNWGGDIESIYYSIAHGVRFAADPDTRYSEMPAFQGVLDASETRAVAAYVASLSREPSSAGLAAAGAPLYADNCAACHGDDGSGLVDLGAPSLADQIWLYGSSEEEIAAQVRTPRHGVMPGWIGRLGESTVKELSVYVHSLGGGE